MWIALQEPANGNKITLPYIYMSTVTDDLVPWVASQTDLLATDWRVVSLAIGGPGLPASYFEEGKRVAEAAREYFKEAEDAEFEEGFEK